MEVAIIGGGPAGLSAALEMAQLPHINWNLYEKKSRISETGGGMSLQTHIWKLLELNGTAKHIRPTDYFRSPNGLVEQRRNGRSGEVLVTKYEPDSVPRHQRSCRLARAKLQGALLKEVDRKRVHVEKRLIAIDHLPNDRNRIRLTFQCGYIADVDLLVAADGSRSLVRTLAFPGVVPRYNGQCVYRTIVSKADAEKIEGIPWGPVFWKNVSGLYVFTCPLGDDDFEVTARIRRSRSDKDTVSWGQPFDLHTLLHEFDDFCQPVRDILRLAARGKTQEFALCPLPPLERPISHNIAFVGDACHALLGNFGCGVGLALEDVYTLARTLNWAWKRDRSLSDALGAFHAIRSPHFKRLYNLMSNFADIKATIRAESLPTDQEISVRVQRISEASQSWMWYYEIDKAVDEFLEAY
ncbi:hypothetical protein PFICI_08684 [Pestalotiopsis fici W106-1]|uniref:FAD-binding domain-containing protein n=1 Tax=Pestalotiopsis fici (strain W106-1 / CGMCC3.15140) TaxID=1229662 RepID=W3X100_PESFW|nr:uncharacterized protein PFICI_08684 [Pestalotiopsis fici W106-1]ETS78831.1 hypothetical protein PFICI_08684 [Pestalotiopsis fici W106-1]